MVAESPSAVIQFIAGNAVLFEPTCLQIRNGWTCKRAPIPIRRPGTDWIIDQVPRPQRTPNAVTPHSSPGIGHHEAFHQGGGDRQKEGGRNRSRRRQQGSSVAEEKTVAVSDPMLNSTTPTTSPHHLFSQYRHVQTQCTLHGNDFVVVQRKKTPFWYCLEA